MEIKEIYNPGDLEDGALFVSSQEEEVKSDILERRNARGRVRWFDRSLGYGFLWEDGYTKEIFVHQSAIQVPGVKKLRKGQRVVFDWCLTADGEIALNVIPIMEREGLLARYRERCARQAAEAARAAEPVPARRGRGRKAARAVPAADAKKPAAEAEQPVRRRGRPKKKVEDEKS